MVFVNQQNGTGGSHLYAESRSNDPQELYCRPAVLAALRRHPSRTAATSDAPGVPPTAGDAIGATCKRTARRYEAMWLGISWDILGSWRCQKPKR